MNESYSYLIKFLFMFLAILALIFILSLLTPKMAAFVDKVIAKLFKKSPERVDDKKLSDNNEPPEVKGPYDPQKEDYDLNYKIYNTDIHGVDFKHGKEKRKKG